MSLNSHSENIFSVSYILHILTYSYVLSILITVSYKLIGLVNLVLYTTPSTRLEAQGLGGLAQLYTTRSMLDYSPLQWHGDDDNDDDDDDVGLCRVCCQYLRTANTNGG